MHQYLIRRNDDDWFDLHVDDFPRAFRVTVVGTEPITGPAEYCLRTPGGATIDITYEDPGLHVCISHDLDEAIADAIVEELLANVMTTTGQPGRIVKLT